MKTVFHLERQGGRIWMAVRWRGDVPARAHKIPGWGFVDSRKPIEWAQEVLGERNAPKGCWSFPLNFRTCLDLRREFADEEIVIHPELWRWAAGERDMRDELDAIRAADDFPTPVLDREYPRLSAAIHERAFQACGVGFAITARRSMNADDPGLGKTLQAIGAAVEARLKGPILVVAPAVAATVTWPDEMRAWAPDEKYVVAEGSRDSRDSLIGRFRRYAESRPERRTWLFINSEMLQTERPPVKTKKGKSVTWDTWLGLDLRAGFGVNYEGALAQLDARTIEPPEPAPGSPAARAEEEYARRMDEWDNELRRHPALFDIVWSGVFLDESHKILPTRSSRKDKQSQVRSGAQKLPIAPNGLAVALSGTPWRGNPLNHWGNLHWLAPQQYSSFWDYAERWFDVADGEHGQVIESIRKGVEHQFGEEVDRYMIRRTKAEAAPWLPAKVYAGTRIEPDNPGSPFGVWLDMGPKQKKAYDEMTAEAVARLESGELQAIGVLAEMTRQKQLACAYGDITQVLRKVPGADLREWADTYRATLPSNKWEWLAEFLDERGITNPKEAWGEGKVVVGSWQTGLLNLYRAELTRLKIPSLILTGETKNADRAAAKTAFQKPGGPRVFLLNTFAGGVSLTLDRADDMVVIDETWVPDDQTQLEDRIHRLSRGELRGPATYWYLRSRGTIDEYIARTTETKDLLQRRLMDGRRGVDLARNLLTGGSTGGRAVA